MRRQDCEWTDREAIEALLDQADWGTLGLVSEAGEALVVPINFVRMENRLYFHGAGQGEKIGALKRHPRASFVVVDAYGQVPSYAFDPVRACPATQFFHSVVVKGTVAFVEDPDLKAAALEAMMRKLQPEGGFEAITAASPTYQASVAGVTVFALAMEEVTGKVKVGQRLSPGARAAVETVLENRGGAQDARTLEALRRVPKA